MTSHSSHSAPPLYSAIAWGLYDWASSAFPTVITTFIFAAYFTQHIAKDPISGTSQWASAIGLSGLIIAVLSPILGATADCLGRRKPWIAFFTGITLISSALLWFAKPTPLDIHWALFWVILGTIGFEIGAVFYNAMMRDLAPKQYLGRLSGWSFGLGYLGGLSCLSIAFVLIYFPIPGLNTAASKLEQLRMSGPLTSLWFALFSLPFFILTKDHPPTGQTFGNATKKGIRQLIGTIKKTGPNLQILKFLLAHMIYMDGLNTLFAFGGIYAAGTFHFSPIHIILLGIFMNLTAGLGAIVFAWLDDYFGSKKMILLALCGLILSGSGSLITHSAVVFWILALLLGLFVGPVQSASRSLMAHLAPAHQLNELFGLYAFSGKVTAFVCPWILGIVTLHFHSQRIGMATIILFLAIGATLLLSVKGGHHSGK